MENETEKLAEEGYKAYGAEAGWKTFDGRPMPTWEQTGPVVQGRWRAAAARIAALVAAALLATGCAAFGHAAAPPPSSEACATWRGAEFAWSQADYLVRRDLADARAAACVVPPPAEPTPPTPRAPPAQVPLPGREQL